MTETSGNLLKSKRSKGLCIIVGCRNNAIKRNKKPCKYCCKCQRQMLKERHPLTYWYDVSRSNAKRRKVEFLITKDEFKRFCEENNYLELKGRGAGKATIDRKKSWIGYTYDNIQIMEHVSNSRKVHIDKKLRAMYETGVPPSKEEIEAFKMELNAFGREIELYEPNENYDF